jgi:hypoxanthine-guanine phosphoribosyltransferase
MYHDDLRILMNDHAIDHLVETLADTFVKFFEGEKVVLFPVLNASYIFAADFSRHLFKKGMRDHSVEPALLMRNFRTPSTQNVKALYSKNSIDKIYPNHTFVILDTVLETAETANTIINIFHTYKGSMGIKNIVLLNLIDKHYDRTRKIAHEDKIFKMSGMYYNEDKWLVGYGLDDDIRGFRGCPDIYQMEKEHECPICKGGIHGFRDKESYKEWVISKMCQKCQDETIYEKEILQ